MIAHDVVVLGTGAAGLMAAAVAATHGARVGLYEKSDSVGGTTAISAGVVWLPLHPHAVGAGVDLDRDDALAYLMSLSHGSMHEDLVEAFVDTAVRMAEWVEGNTPVRLKVIPGLPDYHPERPGGRPTGGRSLLVAPFPFADLGEWSHRVLALPDRSGPGGSPLDVATIERRLGVELDPATPDEVRSQDVRVGGAALVGGLLKACLDRGVLPVTNARAAELVVENGSVTGVVLDVAGERQRVAARRGVVIATGGFEWDDDLAREFLRGPLDGAASPPSNTGDGLRMAMRLGAALGNMRGAWWAPVVQEPGACAWGRQRSALVLDERTRPRCIMVNRQGRRFVNEAASYNAIGAAFHAFDVTRFEYPNVPAWMVFDHEHLRRYGFLGVTADGPIPEWFNRCETLSGLAVRTGLAPAGLESTVADWNERVGRGSDPEFGRGDSVFDTWWATGRSPGGPARSGRWTFRPTMRCGSTAARSAPAAGRGRTSTAGCSTSTALRSPVSTPRATRSPRPRAWPMPVPGARSGRRWCGATGSAAMQRGALRGAAERLTGLLIEPGEALERSPG